VCVTSKAIVLTALQIKRLFPDQQARVAFITKIHTASASPLHSPQAKIPL